jgi:hypothetical protein
MTIVDGQHRLRAAQELQREEIAHLDFDIENKKTHYNHPIDGTLYWCGGKKRRPSDMSLADPSSRRTHPSEITCVDCLHLYIEKGGDWWWEVNRTWYGS